MSPRVMFWLALSAVAGLASARDWYDDHDDPFL